MKKHLTILALLVSASASAGEFSVTAIQPAPGGSDSFTTSTGLKCETSINNSSGYVEKGIMTDHATGSANITTVGAYVRVVTPISSETGTASRLNCNKIYDLELERLRLEIERLKKLDSQPLNFTSDKLETTTNVDAAEEFNIDFK